MSIMTRRSRLVIGLAVSLLASTAVTAAGSGVGPTALRLTVLGNRADLISGGDALVQIVLPRGTSLRDITVLRNESRVTDAFALRPGGRLLGLVTGLRNGTNVLTAMRKDGSGAVRLTITNYPSGGPVFAGKQVQPWICTTVENGFGKPLTKACDVHPRFSYLYKSTNPASTSLQPYDRKSPSSDVASTTTDRGRTVPFIVRREVGVVDRGWYSLDVLIDPQRPWTLSQPQPAWNHKVLATFQGSCGYHHYQHDPLDPEAGAFATEQDNLRLVGRGYLAMTSTLWTLGNSCNETISAEVLMMLKEHITERYGDIRFTIGQGCSGGSSNVTQIANRYPGLLNGIIAACQLTDIDTWSQQEVFSLAHYFESASAVLWNPVQEGAVFGGPTGAAAWTAATVAFAGSYDPNNGANCGGSGSEKWVYNGKTNPHGVRCIFDDFRIGLVGRSKRTGFARISYSNIGTPYGLVALESNEINTEQFVDLNEKIGGVSPDGAFIPQRVDYDPSVWHNEYGAGLLDDGARLPQTPWIDLRGSGPVANSEFHVPIFSDILRARVQKLNGRDSGHAMWMHYTDIAPLPTMITEALDTMDAWLTRLERDARPIPMATKVENDAPVNAKDKCYVGTAVITDMQRCRTLFPVDNTYLGMAGQPLSQDVKRCQLKPLRRSDIATVVPFTDAQWTRLQRVFRTGVCDYSKPSSGQIRSTGWVTFGSSEGQWHALPAAPTCTPCTRSRQSTWNYDNR